MIRCRSRSGGLLLLPSTDAAQIITAAKAGRGDVPLKDLRFRCTKCGSRLTDAVVMAKDALTFPGPP